MEIIRKIFSFHRRFTFFPHSLEYDYSYFHVLQSVTAKDYSLLLRATWLQVLDLGLNSIELLTSSERKPMSCPKWTLHRLLLIISKMKVAPSANESLLPLQLPLLWIWHDIKIRCVRWGQVSSFLWLFLMTNGPVCGIFAEASICSQRQQLISR